MSPGGNRVSAKSFARRSVWTCSILLAAACGVLTTGPQAVETAAGATALPPASSESTATLTDPSSTPRPASTPAATDASPFPTAPKANITRVPWTASGTSFSYQGYLAVFIRDGILYHQRGNQAPLKLAYPGEGTPALLLSDDGEKIVFFRAETGFERIYSINADGSGEQTLVMDRPLPAGLHEGSAQTFVPGTHLLLFNTYECETRPEGPRCAVGLSLVDADTGEKRAVLAPGGKDVYPYSGSFRVSPDGTMIAIPAAGRFEVIDLAGAPVRRNVLPYVPGSSEALFPELSWLLDSSGLIAALPTVTNNFTAYGSLPAYTFWRYTIEDRTIAQLPLDPYPMALQWCDRFQVSPDGNWLLYGGNGDYADPLFLGSLLTADVRPIGRQVCPDHSWSPDSLHFLSGNNLGSVDGPVVDLGPIEPLGWIDDIHFMYVNPANVQPAQIMIRIGEIGAGSVRIHDSGFTLADLVLIIPDPGGWPPQGS
jgi:hypothetical protein